MVGEVKSSNPILNIHYLKKKNKIRERWFQTLAKKTKGKYIEDLGELIDIFTNLKILLYIGLNTLVITLNDTCYII